MVHPTDRRPGSLSVGRQLWTYKMSRRKQSHPKSIKQQAGEEGSDEELSTKLVTLRNCDSEKEHLAVTASDTENINVTDIEDSSDTDSQSSLMSPTAHSINNNTKTTSVEVNTSNRVKSPCSPGITLPSEILQLAKTNNKGELYICCTVPMPKGSSLGPFSGDVVEEKDTNTGCMLEFTENNGNSVYVRVSQDSGTWLKLLSQSEDLPRNSILIYENGHIWLKVISDLDMGTMLVASFAFVSEKVSLLKSEEKDKPIIKESHENSKHGVCFPGSNAEIPVFSALIYQCPYCGVRFSRPHTLEGHLMYYCSKKPKQESPPPPPLAPPAGSANPERVERKPSLDSDEEIVVHRATPDDTAMETEAKVDTSTESGSPSPKAIKTGQTYQCSHCSYTADKLSSLNRHRRIHKRVASEMESNSPKTVLMSETFCKECSIQFTSLSTFKCHKEFYCSSRNHVQSQEISSKEIIKENLRPQESPKNPSPTVTQVLSSPTINTILPVNQLLSNMQFRVSAASVLPAQAAVIVAAPILAPDGVSNLSFTMPTVIVQPVVTSANLSQPVQAHQSSCQVNTPTMTQKDQPLDLSTKRKDEDKLDENQESDISKTLEHNAKTSKKTESQTDCGQGEKSPKPSVGHLQSPVESSLSPVAQYFQAGLPPFSKQPTVLSPTVGQLSQNVSKCMECNIVFYKHENFLAHKQHYCASRRATKVSPQISPKLSPKDENSMLTSTNKNSSDTSKPLKNKKNDDSQRSSPDQTTEQRTTLQQTNNKKSYYRYYCVPCKIKFSSASTLKAHKEFYCPHGKDSEQSLILLGNENLSEGSCSDSEDSSLDSSCYTCVNCRNSYTSSRLYKHHFCPANMQNPMVRCPHCDYIAPTQTKLTEHVKAHTPSRGYRCLLCGYRGNTVRGMRMHGKMHVESGEEFTEKHMVEVEEPPALPVLIENGTVDNPSILDPEAELIRLKNEPYKRRRSRKSYDKVENSNTESLKQSVCTLCGESFPNIHSFLVHSAIHQITQENASTLGDTKCMHQDVSNDTALQKTSEPLPKSSESPKPRAASVKSNSSEPENQSEELPVALHIKSEPLDIGYETTNQACITNQKDLQIKKENDTSDHEISSEANSTKVTTTATVSQVRLLHSRPEGQSSPAGPVCVYNPQFLQPSTSRERINMPGPKTHGPKYCKQCDITFTYLSTFLAHKKYYCSGRLPETKPSVTA